MLKKKNENRKGGEMGKYVSGILVCDLDWGRQKIHVTMMKNRKVVLKPLDFSNLNILF